MTYKWKDNEDFFKWLWGKWEEQVEKRNLPKELIYPFGELTILEYLEKRAEERPDHPAIIFYGREVTFRELNSLVNKFANFLVDKGLKKGDFVGVHLYNSPHYYIAHFGIMKAGGIVVPLDPLWKEIELESPLKDTNMKMIVTQDINYDIIKKIRDEYNLDLVVTASFQDFLPANPTIPLLDVHKIPKKRFSDTVDMKEILDNYSDSPPNIKITLDDPASLDYTGGTTGPPKGCLHKHRGITYRNGCMYTYFRVREDTRFLVFVPIFHTAGRGIIEILVFSGATAILLTKFDMSAFIASIVRYKPTAMWAPSDLYHAIVNTPNLNYDFTSIKYAFTTQYNIRLNEDLRKKWEKLTNGGIICDITYGLTETLSMNTFTVGLQDIDLKKQEELNAVFVGLPMPESYIKIVDSETKEILPPRTVGEIAIKTPALPSEYFNRPEETKKGFLPDGFLLTGDLGMYDEDGFFYYSGRTKEIIKVSGFTVSPREIELIFSRHEAVNRVAVVGIPDPKKGEVPVAFIIPREDYKGKITEEDLIKWAREHMASYKVPKKIFFTDSLPYILGLKVDRNQLKKIALDLLKKS